MTPLETPVKDIPTNEEIVSKFLDRQGFLSQAGILKEEEIHIDGLGWLLVTEITGDQRADLIGRQSVGLLAEQRKIDRKDYERALVLAGVVDPSSPKGARRPMFRPGDMDAVMRVGGGKIAEIVDAIEKLSSLGAYSESAEGNSASTQNGGGTS